jgi:hypothetical protein
VAIGKLSGTLDPSFSAWTRLDVLVSAASARDRRRAENAVLTVAAPVQDFAPALISGTLDPALSAWSVRRVHLRDTKMSGTVPPVMSRWPLEVRRAACLRHV